MKKIFTLIIASFVATIMFAQQPLNPSFETWASATAGELPGGWDGLNSVGVENVFKSDVDPNEGVYSVTMTTINNILLGDLPAVITLGKIDLTNSTVSGGMPYTERPSQLTGFYKYDPAGLDTAIIAVSFYSNGDTIAEAGMIITDAASSWTAFTINIVYTDPATPDTTNILFLTSILQSPIVGTSLEIDNIKFIGGTLDVPTNLMENTISISPNPANTFVNINIPNANNNTKIILHNTVGQVVYSNIFNTNEINERIDVSELKSGIYFVEIINNNKSSIEKLIIK